MCLQHHSFEVLSEEAVSDKAKSPVHIDQGSLLYKDYLLEFDVIRIREVHAVHGKTIFLGKIDQEFS